MTRKGRGLERLVSILERGLASDDIVVTSSDHVIDNVSNIPREVDITIRRDSPVGKILAIVECRDRKGKEDITWIEQLATKVRDVGAPLVIAVSSSGFSPAARTKAAHYGIELRTIEEISNENLQNWIIPCSLTTVIPRHRIVAMTLLSVDPGIADAKIHVDTTTKCFVHSNGNLFSAIDLINRSTGLAAYYPPGDEPDRRETKTFLIELRETGLSLCIDTNGVEVNAIRLEVEMWNEEKEIPSMKMFAYIDEEQRLIGGSEFPLTLEGMEFNLVTHTTAPIGNGTTVKFTLQPKKERK